MSGQQSELSETLEKPASVSFVASSLVLAVAFQPIEDFSINLYLGCYVRILGGWCQLIKIGRRSVNVEKEKVVANVCSVGFCDCFSNA